MPHRTFSPKKTACLFALFTGLLFPLSGVQAHCDAINGPVVEAADKALDSGDFSIIAIWVGESQAEELRQKFEQALAVYKGGGKPQELAKNYFYDVAVRLHRQAEGMCFEGLKPAKPLPRDLAIAEKALDEENPKSIAAFLSEETQQKVNRLLAEVVEAEKTKEQSIEAGRQWVDAYVRYITFVHGLYQAIEAGPAHGLEAHQERVPQ